MATKWTAAQEAAISQRNKTLLLSAAAGSGKTSTLTERIIRSITDEACPADISKMLIVTFTRASAADLKAKIFNAVSDALAQNPQNRHLASQLVKLGSAQISTIDSFYLNAVRQNFSALGLSSSFRIADESETVLMARSAMTDTVNKFYDTEEAFSFLCEGFEQVKASDGVIEEILLSLYTDCTRTPEGIKYLSVCAENMKSSEDTDFFGTPFGQILMRHAVSMFGDYLAVYEDILESMPLDEHLYRAYYDAFDSDRMLCIKALNILEGKGCATSYAYLAELICDYKAPSLKSIGKFASEQSVFCKELRDTFKSDLKVLKEKYFCYTQSDFDEFFSRTADNLSLLYRVLSDFEAQYSEEKKRRNILELTDVKRYALKLFANSDGTPTALARALAEEFSDIYIDEYQDVDPVQDLIFRCISTKHNRFMVGDIKQSIYSFRGARPQLFADYRADFPTHGTPAAEDSDCETVFMSENFRCAKSVIDFTNLICADIFKACGTSIGYTDADDLVYAKKPPEGAPDAPDVCVCAFAKNPKNLLSEDTDASSLPSPADAEAKYIAHEIHRLITSEKKQDGSPISPSDIAVLFRNKKSAKRISEALAEYGIMTTQTDATQYFSNPDVIMMLCILNAIDNPQRDIQLAGAMRSPIFGFTLEDLLLINEYGTSAEALYDKTVLCSEEASELGERCRDFLQTLDMWRGLSVSLPIDKFLSRLFATDAFTASGLVSEKNALGEGGNLKRLYEYARTFEAGSFKGLYNFIEFINALIENGKTIDARSEASGSDCVTLTTIHKSKGLEFPVCFVCNAAAAFNTAPSNPNLTFEYGSGIAMSLSDRTGFARYESPFKRLLDLDADQKCVEEEMRVLYVALTRAKERLYVTGSYSRQVMPNVLLSAEFGRRLRAPYFLLSAGSYMDWIMSAMCTEQASRCARLYTYTTDSLPNFGVSITEQGSEAESAEFNKELYQKLHGDFEFDYPYRQKSRIPAKLSVSKLSPDVLDSTDTSVSLFDTEAKPTVPDFFLGTKKRASASERGTATHLFLQFCNFEQLKTQGVAQTLSALVENAFIPERIAECVYTEELERFRESELLTEILSAQRIIREQRFNILLPAKEFSLDEAFIEHIKDEKIAVQGVIDLLLITNDGKILLFDYKTDRLTQNELDNALLAHKRINDTHASQLSYYAKAVEAMFGRAPDKIAIYSTHAARLFDIDIRSLKIPPDIL